MNHQAKAISEKEFRELLETKLGQYTDRAVDVLNNFGPRLSLDVYNVMLHAADKGKEEEVLTILENHWKQHLQFQHPEIRGSIENMGVNQTQRTFLKICQETLSLIPTANTV